MDGPCLVRWRVVGAKSRGIFASKVNITLDDVAQKAQTISLLLWSCNAKGTVYACSHSHVLAAEVDQYGYFLISEASMKEKGITPIPLEFGSRGGRYVRQFFYKRKN